MDSASGHRFARQEPGLRHGCLIKHTNRSRDSPLPATYICVPYICIRKSKHIYLPINLEFVEVKL